MRQQSDSSQILRRVDKELFGDLSGVQAALVSQRFSAHRRSTPVDVLASQRHRCWRSSRELTVQHSLMVIFDSMRVSARRGGNCLDRAPQCPNGRRNRHAKPVPTGLEKTHTHGCCTVAHTLPIREPSRYQTASVSAASRSDYALEASSQRRMRRAALDSRNFPRVGAQAKCPGLPSPYSQLLRFRLHRKNGDH